jgi:hypothetical protein
MRIKNNDNKILIRFLINDNKKFILVNTGRNVEESIGMRIKKNNDNKIIINDNVKTVSKIMILIR